MSEKITWRNLIKNKFEGKIFLGSEDLFRYSNEHWATGFGIFDEPIKKEEFDPRGKEIISAEIMGLPEMGQALILEFEDPDSYNNRHFGFSQYKEIEIEDKN